MTEWYDFPNVKSTKMLSFLFGSRGLRPDLPSPFGRKFLFCICNYHHGSNCAIVMEAEDVLQVGFGATCGGSICSVVLGILLRNT